MYICILQNCTPIHTGDIARLLIKIRLQIFGNPPNPKNIYFPNNMNIDMRERERERERENKGDGGHRYLPLIRSPWLLFCVIVLSLKKKIKWHYLLPLYHK